MKMLDKRNSIKTVRNPIRRISSDLIEAEFLNGHPVTPEELDEAIKLIPS